MHSRVSTLFLLAAALALAACAKDPVTGKRQLVLVSEGQEVAMGQQASRDVEASMGLYDNVALQSYVEELGLRIAAASERPHLPWRFRVIDSPVVNAFALPGGYIYVTRGILAYMNNEAALVGVLGHEVGHVTARHHVEQITKQQLASVGLNVGTVFFPEVRPFGDVLGGGLGLLFLKFGRDAERESDRLGVQYSLAQGYDPTEMAEFFSVLGALSGGERQIPSWASTHPDPDDRRATIRALVQEQEIAGSERAVRQREYLEQIDGLIVGENPREGFMDGQRFLHPDLEFQLRYPDGWTVQNTKTVVYAASPDGGAAIQLTASPAAPGTSPEEHARVFFRKNQLEYGTGERLRAGPFEAYRAPFRALTGTGELYGQAGFIVDGELAYEIIGLTRPNTFRRYTPIFNEVIESFDRLRDRAALEVQPDRLALYQVPTAMTMREALTRAGMDEARFDELSVLNATALTAQLESGSWVKVVQRAEP